MNNLYSTTGRKLRLIASALLFTVTWAATAQTADPCEGKTYQWVDENGVTRTAPYLETATNEHPNQMKALVASLFADQTIPGQKRFGYYFKNSDVYGNTGINYWYSSLDGHSRTTGGSDNVSGNYWVWMNYYIWDNVKGTQNVKLPESTETRPWRPENQIFKQYRDVAPMLNELDFESFNHPDNSNTAQRTEITPEEDGKTALLIEMTDDYNATQDLDPDVAWSHIKSITVLPLTRQYRVENEKNPERSGFLFNINRPLNKFFVAIKGDIMDRGTTSCFAPLYEGYEQLAPSVEDADYKFGKYVENAYSQMLGGSVFPVSHNCASVPARAHATMMGGKSDSDAIQANMLIWLPDYRYYDQELSEINSYTQTSSVDYRPYFFIYNIPLTSTLDNIDNSTHNVQVKNSWTSSLKNVTNDDEPERFRLLRSYDRTNWSEVPANEIEEVITTGATKDPATGYLTHNASTVEVLVHEKQYAEPDTVYYKVFGRLANTEFDEVASNETMVPIPGYASGTTPKLTIALKHVSDFDKKKQQNNYENTVSFLLQGNDTDGIKSENIGDNTLFYLKRYRHTGELDKTLDNFSVDNGTTVATVKFTYKDKNTWTGIYQYEVVVTDVTGAEPVSAAPYILYSGPGKVLGVVGSPKEFHFEGEYDANSVWGSFVDKFSYSLTQDGHADDATYYYRLFAEDAHNVTTTGKSGEIRSNVAKAIMPPMTHDAGFTSYSLDEIKGDQDAHLEPSTPLTTFIPLSASPTVKKCVIELADENTVVAEADLTDQGIWVMKGYGADGSVIDENTLQAGNGGSISVSADNAYMDRSTVMIIHDGDNTYGTARVTLPILPVVKVYKINLEYDNYYRNGYNTTAKLSVSLPESADDNFRSHGYGVWSIEGIVQPPLMREIDSKNHHKHNSDTEACTFWYDKDMPANTVFAGPAANSATTPGDMYEEGSICDSEASASISEFREARQGSKQAPYARWYKARYYARYISPAEMDGSSEVTKAPAQPRYIVVENRGGAREEGDNHTTGVTAADVLPDAVYPRVTDDIVNIDGRGEVLVCNLQGMTVAALDDNHDDTATRTVSLGNLPAGIYFVRLNGKSYKVIKN